MKRKLYILTVCFLTTAVPAENRREYMSAEEMMEAGREWLQNNADPEIVAAIDSIDAAAVRTFWRQLQQRLHGEYVLDLADLKNKAGLILAFLEQIEDGKPYAAWLRTRMDYFTVARELRFRIPPPGGQERPRRQIPSAEVQRKVWRRQLAESDAPRGYEHYVDKLKPIFKSAGLPPELVWLAEVESSFNPRARSPVGAAGLFQFMPATARQYGLSLSPEDERLDPVKSAHAAAKYLDYLHSRFDSWPLALAAYNAGEGRVSRLLKKQRSQTFAAISPSLPAETQLYVPKIEATIHRREGIALDSL